MFTSFSAFKLSMEALIGIISTAVLAVLGWAFNINSKVNVAQQQTEDLKELINAKFDLVLKRFDDFDGRLERVEHSIDSHYGDKNG